MKQQQKYTNTEYNVPDLGHTQTENVPSCF